MTRVRKTFVCLANSRKPRGRCVAGREWNAGQFGGWIRPVGNGDGKSDEISEAVSSKEMMYEDCTYPKPLDVISVHLIGKMPHEYQKENWLIDSKHCWIKERREKWDTLFDLTGPMDHLWELGRNSASGKNNMVSKAAAKEIDHTLRLVEVHGLEVSVGNTPKRPVRANFSFNNQDYGLKVTDPIIEQRARSKETSSYIIDKCFITVSLVGPSKNDGRHVKLAAAIIEP